MDNGTVQRRKAYTSKERILRRHALTPEQLEEIMRRVAVRYGQSAFDWVKDVDPKFGVGLIDANAKCVWTRDGRRITLVFFEGGGFSPGWSPGPDPECRVYGGWPEQLRLWVISLFSRNR